MNGIQLKGSKEGLKIFLSGNAVLEHLSEKISANIAFFKGAKVLVELEAGGRWTFSQLKAVSELLEFHGLSLLGFQTPGESPGVEHGEHPQQKNEESKSQSMVRRTLRSGQRMDVPGDLIFWGDVNPGAEVIAGGNIIVMGSLRGLAHAGAHGNTHAVIMALRLNPTQLRIADRMSRPPDGEDPKPSQPEVARIHQDYIIIEPLGT